METVKISFDIETSDAECPLGVEIWLDDAVLLATNHVQEKIAFAHDMSDDDGEEDDDGELFNEEGEGGARQKKIKNTNQKKKKTHKKKTHKKKTHKKKTYKKKINNSFKNKK